MRNLPTALARFVTATILLMIVSTLVLLEVVRRRAASRSSLCAMRLTQIGLAVHNYHSAFKQLPRAFSGTSGGPGTNEERLGPLVALLPFTDQQLLWEKISNPFVNELNGNLFQPMGPAPWYDPNDYTPWRSAPASYRCPASINPDDKVVSVEPRVVTTLAMPLDANGSSRASMATNYVYSVGDSLARAGIAIEDYDRRHAYGEMRGIFIANKKVSFRDVLDGISNTMMFSEAVSVADSKNENSRIANNVNGIRANPSLCLQVHRDGVTDWWDTGRGQRWNDGTLAIGGFQSILPPNSPSCLSELGIDEPLVSASSQHVDGVHILMGDGVVKFISNSIDCGDVTAPAVSQDSGMSPPGCKSPYGIWGSLGSRAAKEVIAGEFGQVVPRQTHSHAGNASAAGEMSVWTDRDGKVKLRAKLVRIIERKTVELEDTIGVLHRVPLNSLSDVDIYRSVMMSLQSETQR
ncbi:DUF1559 domain-containing protein [Rhodopirellula sp. SWK7]|uniref:DUF1559 domain-containing protein n=1 Tax=Rhodopirellula sp. SWK7 TaxID=595460 RepID=UPI0002BD958C|nr:DUF1559 domain-containing protein [Rhodopirellula sp. SWK7]EMI47177.1 protein containing DUF1559 [Rhodopirellula sp. SWK7]